MTLSTPTYIPDHPQVAEHRRGCKDNPRVPHRLDVVWNLDPGSIRHCSRETEKAGVDKSPEVLARMEDMKKRVVVEAYLKKKVEEQVTIADADLQKIYDQKKDKFKSDAQVKASHILLKTAKEANDVLAQVKAGGKFEDLAKKYSIDPAGAKGGDLGW